jgi:GT2 family glycosyltransferase
MIELAIVIPTFNRKSITIDIINRINLVNLNIKIFICDSGSTDGTVKEVLKLPNVYLINVGINAWWSTAVNAGIKKAISYGYQAVLLMNDDIIFDNSLIMKIIDVFNHNKESIISPVQITKNGIYVGTNYIGFFKKNKNTSQINSNIYVETTNGCCLLIPSKIFYKIGFINDKKCPHHYGDVEFQLRAKNNGFKTLVSPLIKIRQLENTKYYSKISIRHIFSHPSSPLNVNAYFQFGGTLFNSKFNFIIFGLSYHYDYLKSLIKFLFLKKLLINN